MEEAESQWGVGTPGSSNLRGSVGGGEEAGALLRK